MPSPKADFAVENTPSLDFSVWPVGAAVMATAHTHPDVEVNFLLKGKLRYLLNGRFLDIQPGEIAIFWAGFPHQTMEKKANLEGIWMTLPLVWLLGGKYTMEMTTQLLQGNLICRRATPDNKSAFERWREDFANPDPQFREIAKAEIGSFLSRLALSLKKPAGQPALRLPVAAGNIDRVLDFLAANYRETITADDIANAVGLHPKYLLVLFRRSCRITLWEYVVKLRLAHAQRLLLTTDRTVADIAFAAGFNSLSAFYHAFARHVSAASPSAFRAGYAAENRAILHPSPPPISPS